MPKELLALSALRHILYFTHCQPQITIPFIPLHKVGVYLISHLQPDLAINISASASSQSEHFYVPAKIFHGALHKKDICFYEPKPRCPQLFKSCNELKSYFQAHGWNRVRARKTLEDIKGKKQLKVNNELRS